MNRPTDSVLIVNTKSRRGKDLFSTAKSILEAEGVKFVDAWASSRPEEVMRKTREAIGQGIPLVIVGGGDGTLSSVVRWFIGSGSTLGVLPLGTGNEFVRDLGISPDVKRACHVLISGRLAEVDVGRVEDSYFLNVATVGLTTLIAQGLRSDVKRRFGRLAYMFALARSLTRARPFRATLTVPDGSHSFETLQVVVGNGRYHAGPFPIAPNATITDGSLTAYAVATTNRWDLLRFALHLPGGRHVNLDDVPAFNATTIKLETTPPQRVVTDGEIKYRTPILFGVTKGGLRVMVPPESPVLSNNP